jgi:triosephosphate isomerase
MLGNAEKIVFVYEPPSAISGGGEFRPEDPQEVNQKAEEISSKIGGKVVVLYGGSLNQDNAHLFFDLSNIDGGLVGQASLDASSFSKICQA